MYVLLVDGGVLPCSTQLKYTHVHRVMYHVPSCFVDNSACDNGQWICCLHKV